MSSKSKYICPMHPDIFSNKPGKCPKCGMKLEKTQESQNAKNPDKNNKLDHQHHGTVHQRDKHTKEELGEDKFKSHVGHHEGMDPMEHHQMMAEDFKKRFFVVLPLTITVLVLSHQIQEWFGYSLDFLGREWLLFVLGTVIVVYGGRPFFEAAKNEISTRNFGMMTLVSLALSAGYLFSAAATFLFPGELLWWEISTLALAFLFGHWMEMRAVIGTGGALKELAKLIPDTAHLIKGSTSRTGRASSARAEIVDVGTGELQRGDLILVKPGERIPADGVVIEGSSSVDESMITGESLPIAKQIDSEVVGGSINNDGSLIVSITKTGAESALAQIMDLIRQAQNTKPKVQELADKAANVLTLTAIVVGAGTFIYWFLINPSGAVFAATLAITVVVIACPHALGLAIPTVTTITSSLAAKNGILIRDMKGLEIMKNLQYIVLDKTGTLTEGKFGVTKMVESSKQKVVRDEILRLAAAVEMHSQHSIAQGVLNYAKENNIEFDAAKDFKSYPGKGAEGKVGGDLVVVGNRMMMEEKNIKFQISNFKFQIEEEVGTFVYVARNKELLGVIILEDRIRDESKGAIDEFHGMGMKVAMLTGDKKEVAEKVGKELGIDTVYAEVLPDQKTLKVKELQDKGYVVGMVGDGVNDAPALTQAHVGIAIGAGTSVAIESAEIVLVRSNPRDIVKAVFLSRKTNAKMKQNLAWATGYNVLAIPAAAGVFIPWGIMLRPEWGALLMSASSLIVVANALLLKRVRL
jgi:P-type Cu2+ transporter